MTHDNSIENQAGYYLTQIRKNKTTTVYFFPLKKSPQAASNKFRLAVLQHLTSNYNTCTLNQAERLKAAEKNATAAGYIIKEVSAQDYDRKAYKSTLNQ